MAFSVTAVSIKVSPLRIDDEDTDMFITSAPSRLPASSKLACVRVEASKNMLISVRPRSEAVFFSIWRLSSTNSSAKSSRPTMSAYESPSIPSKWRLLRTNEDFWAMFIKAARVSAGWGRSKAGGPTIHKRLVVHSVPRNGTMAAGADSPEIDNQTPPYVDVDLYGTDQALQEAVKANGAAGEAASLSAFGRHWGTVAMFE